MSRFGDRVIIVSIGISNVRFTLASMQLGAALRSQGILRFTYIMMMRPSFHSRYLAGGEMQFRFSPRKEVLVSKSSCVVRDLESLFPCRLTSATVIRKGQQTLRSRGALNWGCP